MMNQIIKNLRSSLTSWTDSSAFAPIIIWLLFISSITLDIYLILPSISVYEKIRIFFNLIISKPFTDFLKIIIWPAVILSATYVFRKAFTYLFISVEELNIFGSKFKIKSPYEVIEKRAQLMFQNMKEEEEKAKFIEEKEGEMVNLRETVSRLAIENTEKEDSKEYYKKQAERYNESYNKALKIAEDYSKDYKNLLEDYRNFVDKMKNKGGQIYSELQNFAIEDSEETSPLTETGSTSDTLSDESIS